MGTAIVEGAQLTILVVEDQEPVLRVVERSLTRAGFRVIGAGSPQEGVDRLRDHEGRVDLLLTDVVMPQMSGPELALLARKTSPELRVLFMSGYTSESVADRLSEVPGASILEKPFRPADLVAKVMEALGRT